jgi:hypothetical protein
LPPPLPTKITGHISTKITGKLVAVFGVEVEQEQWPTQHAPAIRPRECSVVREVDKITAPQNRSVTTSQRPNIAALQKSHRHNIRANTLANGGISRDS